MSAIDFWQQVGRGHIQRYTGGQRQPDARQRGQKMNGGYTGNSGGTQDARRRNRDARTATAGQHHAADRKTFGEFMQQHSGKDKPAECTGERKTAGDGDAVKKCMRRQTECYGVSGGAMEEFLSVSFLSKVKMRDQSMFQQM